MSDITTRLRGLLVAQFFGAFNDNAWRVIVTLLAIDAVQRSGGAEAAAQARTTLATVVLTVPLIAFSVPAGLISDRFSKRTVIIVMKAVEIVLMAAAAGVLFVQPQGGVPALVILGCMGAQSALFSPSKYGILPELLPHSRLSLGNGVLEMWSTLAIIAGTASAGLLLGLAGPPWIAGALLCVLSLAGFGAALTVPAVPAARSSGGLMASLREGWSAINTDRVLRLAVLGSIFFWLVASIFFQVIVVYVKTHLGLANAPASMALGVLMAGIAAGGGRNEIGGAPAILQRSGVNAKNALARRHGMAAAAVERPEGWFEAKVGTIGCGADDRTADLAAGGGGQHRCANGRRGAT